MKKILYQAQCVIGSCPVVELECAAGVGCPTVELSDEVLYRAQCVVGGCPEIRTEDEMVVIHDPDKPERGKVFLTKEEWNDIKKNAPLVD